MKDNVEWNGEYVISGVENKQEVWSIEGKHFREEIPPKAHIWIQVFNLN